MKPIKGLEIRIYDRRLSIRNQIKERSEKRVQKTNGVVAQEPDMWKIDQNANEL